MTTKESKEPHRASNGQMSVYAPAFVRGRLVGFQKDMQICLTPIDLPEKKNTAAFFPALATCCATLEYLSALHRGNLDSVGHKEIAAFAVQYLPQPDYDSETIRVLFEAFRNTVAHRGISTGVWVDKRPGVSLGRRLVWKITVGSRQPACSVSDDKGEITRDSPWPAKFTHRFHIRLGTLSNDIVSAAMSYAQQLETDKKLQAKFEKCMKQMYAD